jgi:hypothetical protein
MIMVMKAVIEPYWGWTKKADLRISRSARTCLLCLCAAYRPDTTTIIMNVQVSDGFQSYSPVSLRKDYLLASLLQETTLKAPNHSSKSKSHAIWEKTNHGRWSLVSQKHWNRPFVPFLLNSQLHYFASTSSEKLFLCLIELNLDHIFIRSIDFPLFAWWRVPKKW